MQQNRDRNGRPRNTRPYDLNRDVARTSAPSQDHTPRSTGSSRYGYNGEPLSRPPSRSAIPPSTPLAATRRAADPKTRSLAASSAARQTMPAAGRTTGKTRTRKTTRTGSIRQAVSACARRRAPRSKALPGGSSAKSAR
mgnify:CR=1 FL=1